MFRRKLMLLGLVTIFGFAVTFVYALWVLGSPPEPPLRDTPQERLRISVDAELVRQFLFDDGSIGATLLSSVPYELVGLTSTELAESHPQWGIVSFAPHRVVVTEACPEPTGGFLRSENNALVIYEGTVGGCHKPVATVEIDVSRIPPLQASELAQGVPFDARDDLSVILDGVMAP